jgi:hypothetical protein
MVGAGTTAPIAHCAPRPKTSHRKVFDFPSERMNERLGRYGIIMIVVRRRKAVIVMRAYWTASAGIKPPPATVPSNLSEHHNPCPILHIHFVRRQKPADRHP